MNAAATQSNSGVGITSSGRYLGGGGGGTTYIANFAYFGYGGRGGGGNGGSDNRIMPTVLPEAGVVNTGGGGGGRGYLQSGGSTTGGSGVAVIRYADVYPLANATTGSPNVTIAGGFITYKFTQSGTIQF